MIPNQNETNANRKPIPWAMIGTVVFITVLLIVFVIVIPAVHILNSQYNQPGEFRTTLKELERLNQYATPAPASAGQPSQQSQ